MLRAFHIEYPLFYRGDWHRGASLAPGVEGWMREEGEAYIKINPQGLRDIEHELVKPANVYRIGVLGDSYAEAVQVDLRDTFWSRLESELSQCKKLGELQVEVINFGVSGYGTAQQLITLRNFVWPYSPDLVLLAFYQDNDIEDNSKQLAAQIHRPFFVIKGDELELDVSFRESDYYKKSVSEWVQFKTSLINQVRLLQLMQHAKKLWDQRQLIAANEEKKQHGKTVSKGLSSSLYSEPKTKDWMDAWEVTERLIERMNAEIKERGVDFIVVTLSAPIQVHPDPAKRKSFVESSGIENIFYADDRIGAFAKEKGISVLNLARPMQNYAEKNQVFFHGFSNTQLGSGHWNSSGHAFAARLISQELCDKLIEG